jgi:hypothetical protein
MAGTESIPHASLLEEPACRGTEPDASDHVAPTASEGSD